MLGSLPNLSALYAIFQNFIQKALFVKNLIWRPGHAYGASLSLKEQYRPLEAAFCHEF